jgi:hypothetical protein
LSGRSSKSEKSAPHHTTQHTKKEAKGVSNFLCSKFVGVERVRSDAFTSLDCTCVSLTVAFACSPMSVAVFYDVILNDLALS